MDLGVRHIRTAGKGSGSVELTLPGALRQLVGLPCRITLHDGARLDIVLQPDLSRALEAFGALWRALTFSLASGRFVAGGEVFPADGFSFGLQPRASGGEMPYLCWEDGLALAAGAVDMAPPARSIAACAARYAADIDIALPLAEGFGAVCGFLACGTMIFPEWQEPCDIAAAALAARGIWQPGTAWQRTPDTTTKQFWLALTPGLDEAARLFAGWSEPGTAYADLRTAWRRGRAIELNRGVS